MITMTCTGRADEIAARICDQLTSQSISCELIERFTRAESVIMVLEKYYWRNSSRASLTVVVTQSGDHATVDAVASGGGQGAFLGFDWGAGSNFENSVRNALADMNLR